eukprot:842229-Amphidinium_carterae.1
MVSPTCQENRSSLVAHVRRDDCNDDEQRKIYWDARASMAIPTLHSAAISHHGCCILEMVAQLEERLFRNA